MPTTAKLGRQTIGATPVEVNGERNDQLDFNLEGDGWFMVPEGVTMERFLEKEQIG